MEDLNNLNKGNNSEPLSQSTIDNNNNNNQISDEEDNDYNANDDDSQHTICKKTKNLSHVH